MRNQVHLGFASRGSGVRIPSAPPSASKIELKARNSMGDEVLKRADCPWLSKSPLVYGISVMGCNGEKGSAEAMR